MKLTVTLNGSDTNPWHRMGLKQNPFPQIAKAEYDAAERRLNALDGDPIKNEADLRKRLEGFSAELVDICLRMYEPGKRVRFTVEWPDEG